MNIRRFFVGKTIGSIVVVVVVGGFFLLNNYIYQEKQGDGTAQKPYRATLEGVYECLPYTGVAETTSANECEPGIQTDAGEHYAVNFFLMSQMHAPLEVGQRFSATGVITDGSSDPLKWQAYALEGVFSVTDSLTVLGEDDETDEIYACTADAKLCPDGSAVGRQGPNCEFAACPSIDNTPTQVTTSLGSTATALNVTISPQEVISDSRCPTTVECIWAGTVEVRTTLATQVAHGEHVLTLGEPQTFGDYTVTLIEVSPIKTEADIPNASYQFTYSVSL